MLFHILVGAWEFTRDKWRAALITSTRREETHIPTDEIDKVLSSGIYPHSFPQPVPLLQLLPNLLDIWEEEGFFD